MRTKQKRFQRQPFAQLMTLIGLVLGLNGLTSQPAAAGIGDRPPILSGTTKRAIHVYSVPSVRNTPIVPITTAFRCASTEKTGGKNIVWAVEIFDTSLGLLNDVTAGQGVLGLSPGDTDIITLAPTSALPADAVLSAFVSQGSARILATSTKIICSAFLMDPDNNPATLLTPLPVIKKATHLGH